MHTSFGSQYYLCSYTAYVPVTCACSSSWCMPTGVSSSWCMPTGVSSSWYMRTGVSSSWCMPTGVSSSWCMPTGVSSSWCVPQVFLPLGSCRQVSSWCMPQVSLPLGARRQVSLPLCICHRCFFLLVHADRFPLGACHRCLFRLVHVDRCLFLLVHATDVSSSWCMQTGVSSSWCMPQVCCDPLLSILVVWKNNVSATPVLYIHYTIINNINNFISKGEHIWHECQSNIWSAVQYL